MQGFRPIPTAAAVRTPAGRKRCMPLQPGVSVVRGGSMQRVGAPPQWDGRAGLVERGALGDAGSWEVPWEVPCEVPLPAVDACPDDVSMADTVPGTGSPAGASGACMADVERLLLLDVAPATSPPPLKVGTLVPETYQVEYTAHDVFGEAYRQLGEAAPVPKKPRLGPAPGFVSLNRPPSVPSLEELRALHVAVDWPLPAFEKCGLCQAFNDPAGDLWRGEV